MAPLKKSEGDTRARESSAPAGQRNAPAPVRQIALIVNGNSVEMEVEARMTLAEFLREKMGLTGTKVGCNRGECGSCTVILDGEAVYSCSMLAVEAAGRDVTTIEGVLEGDGRLHPIQEAFVEYDALQCGFCTPGMVLSLKAFLDKRPRATEEEVRNTIDGNLCRCGCYPNILKAALSAAEKMARRGGERNG
jgi:aerobic-type carbon monoxide dehydrogenase small subunit (CoxS/CutS family)